MRNKLRTACRFLVSSLLIGLIYVGVCLARGTETHLRPFKTVQKIDLPGRLPTTRGPSLNDLRAKLEQRRLVHERQSIITSRRIYNTLRQAGGLGPFLEKKRIEATKLVESSKRSGAGPPQGNGAELQLSVVNKALSQVKLCNKPWVWLTNEDAPPLFPDIPRNPFDPVIELKDQVSPGNEVSLLGCDFGTAVGSVALRLMKTGQLIQLQTNVPQAYWQDTYISVFFPRGISGVPDQPAEITVFDSHNVASDPIPVDFIAEREVQTMDTANHQDLVSVNDECFTATTDDTCGGIIATGSGPHPRSAGFMGKHYKQCCKSVTGTDKFFIKLMNGWKPAEFDSVPFALNPTDGHGWTDCDFFNEPGKYLGSSTVTLDNSEFTAEIDVTWHVDWACSGFFYAGDLAIMGPKGTTFF